METFELDVKIVFKGTVEVEAKDKLKAHDVALKEAKRQLNTRTGAQDLEIVDWEVKS